MSTTTWTVADLAELTSKAVQLAITDVEQYCEHCGVAQTPKPWLYCDSCAQSVVNYLLCEEHSKLEQLVLCLHMVVIDEDIMVGRGLY